MNRSFTALIIILQSSLFKYLYQNKKNKVSILSYVHIYLIFWNIRFYILCGITDIACGKNKKKNPKTNTSFSSSYHHTVCRAGEYSPESKLHIVTPTTANTTLVGVQMCRWEFTKGAIHTTLWHKHNNGTNLLLFVRAFRITKSTMRTSLDSA